MKNEDLIQPLKDCGAVQFGRFVLTSGAISEYYIDIKKGSTKPKVLREIASRLAGHTSGYTLLAGMELGAVPLAVALSLETDIPYLIIRKKEREHGTKKQIEGDIKEGDKVLVIEDVTTSGGSTEKAVNAIRAAGGIVDEVIVVVDRESGATEKLAKIGVKLIPLLSVSQILEKK